MSGAVVHAKRRRWLIEVAPGDVHLVSSRAELGNLLRYRSITGETRVYEVGAGPRPLRNIPELARLLPEAEDAEPPIRPRAVPVDTRSPERVKLSEELAVLNRPLEGDIEYYDEVPRSSAKRVLATLLIMAALGGASYLLAQRHRGDDDTAAVTAKAPATERAPTLAPIAPIAPGPATGAASRASAAPRDPEPEGDPPLPSAAARPERSSRGR